MNLLWPRAGDLKHPLAGYLCLAFCLVLFLTKNFDNGMGRVTYIFPFWDDNGEDDDKQETQEDE